MKRCRFPVSGIVAGSAIGTILGDIGISGGTTLIRELPLFVFLSVAINYSGLFQSEFKYFVCYPVRARYGDRCVSNLELCQLLTAFVIPADKLISKQVAIAPVVARYRGIAT